MLELVVTLLGETLPDLDPTLDEYETCQMLHACGLAALDVDVLLRKTGHAAMTKDATAKLFTKYMHHLILYERR